MSSAVLRRCYRRLGRLGLQAEVERLVVEALLASRSGPARLLCDAGVEAGLATDLVLDRASAAFANFAGFNLSDDLSDGECTYLPAAQGPAVLLMLQGLFMASLAELELPADVQRGLIADLVAAEEAQVLEIGTTRWDAPRLTQVTDGIAGRQWSGYLRLMWAGTKLEEEASEVARDFGRVALLAGDVGSGDERFTSLTPDDRSVIVEQALVSSRRLEARGLACLTSAVAECERVLLSYAGGVSLERVATSLS